VNLDHVQLAMPEGGEPSARWYFGDLLGMTEETKPTELVARGGCWFHEVAASCALDPAFVPQRKAHPAFAVEDLERLAARLTQAGTRRPMGLFRSGRKSVLHR
jgi:hypothetical protein